MWFSATIFQPPVKYVILSKYIIFLYKCSGFGWPMTVFIMLQLFVNTDCVNVLVMCRSRTIRLLRASINACGLYGPSIVHNHQLLISLL